LSKPLSKIDEVLARMEFGNIAFNVPPSMGLEKAERIELLLSLKQTEEELKGRLRDDGVIVNDIQAARVKISDKMQAGLSGDGFLITPITPDTLPVSKQETTQWQWDVRALRGGTLHLHVVLNAIVDLDDGTGAHPYPIRTFEHTYDVEVPWSEGAVATFLKSNWQWLWITLVAPAGAWVWNRKRKKRAKAGFV
jgi:hypothetical protein